MAFPFLQRGNPSEFARQLSLTSYEPVIVLEELATGIDNVRHDVFLSPKFCESARQHIFKLIAKHGGVEELVSVDPISSGADNGLSRVRDSRTPTLKPYDTLDFKRQLAELHL